MHIIALLFNNFALDTIEQNQEKIGQFTQGCINNNASFDYFVSKNCNNVQSSASSIHYRVSNKAFSIKKSIVGKQEQIYWRIWPGIWLRSQGGTIS